MIKRFSPTLIIFSVLSLFATYSSHAALNPTLLTQYFEEFENNQKIQNPETEARIDTLLHQNVKAIFSDLDQYTESLHALNLFSQDENRKMAIFRLAISLQNHWESRYSIELSQLHSLSQEQVPYAARGGTAGMWIGMMGQTIVERNLSAVPKYFGLLRQVKGGILGAIVGTGVGYLYYRYQKNEIWLPPAPAQILTFGEDTSSWSNSDNLENQMLDFLIEYGGRSAIFIALSGFNIASRALKALRIAKTAGNVSKLGSAAGGLVTFAVTSVLTEVAFQLIKWGIHQREFDQLKSEYEKALEAFLSSNDEVSLYLNAYNFTRAASKFAIAQNSDFFMTQYEYFTDLDHLRENCLNQNSNFKQKWKSIKDSEDSEKQSELGELITQCYQESVERYDQLVSDCVISMGNTTRLTGLEDICRKKHLPFPDREKERTKKYHRDIKKIVGNRKFKYHPDFRGYLIRKNPNSLHPHDQDLLEQYQRNWNEKQEFNAFLEQETEQQDYVLSEKVQNQGFQKKDTHIDVLFQSSAVLRQEARLRNAPFLNERADQLVKMIVDLDFMAQELTGRTFSEGPPSLIRPSEPRATKDQHSGNIEEVVRHEFSPPVELPTVNTVHSVYVDLQNALKLFDPENRAQLPNYFLDEQNRVDFFNQLAAKITSLSTTEYNAIVIEMGRIRVFEPKHFNTIKRIADAIVSGETPQSVNLVKEIQEMDSLELPSHSVGFVIDRVLYVGEVLFLLGVGKGTFYAVKDGQFKIPRNASSRTAVSQVLRPLGTIWRTPLFIRSQNMTLGMKRKEFLIGTSISAAAGGIWGIAAYQHIRSIPHKLDPTQVIEQDVSEVLLPKVAETLSELLKDSEELIQNQESLSTEEFEKKLDELETQFWGFDQLVDLLRRDYSTAYNKGNQDVGTNSLLQESRELLRKLKELKSDYTQRYLSDLEEQILEIRAENLSQEEVLSRLIKIEVATLELNRHLSSIEDPDLYERQHQIQSEVNELLPIHLLSSSFLLSL